MKITLGNDRLSYNYQKTALNFFLQNGIFYFHKRFNILKLVLEIQYDHLT